MSSRPPRIDDNARRRLTARFGAGISSWFDELPTVLTALAERWQLEFGSLIPRGTMSIVICCQRADGARAVLKISPDHGRLANEAAALNRWTTGHTPSVLAVEQEVGALLLEAIEPGLPLVDSPAYPSLESVADLLISLRESGAPDPSYPSLAHRVAYLFDSSTKLYTRNPELNHLVPLELYERGRQLATRLAGEVSPTSLLHGDLTPSNILDGGNERGLVAVDPAPCLGEDPAFDAVDLLLWRADDVDTVSARADHLAPALNVDAGRLLDWCTAFSGMVALELAEAPERPRQRLEALVKLANRPPTR